jgi:enamine deaminase RidA (YjgF/YER057c/UK114 family)
VTKFIDPPGLWKSPRFANIAVAGDLAFIAGQAAFDEKGDVVGVGDIKAQCEKVCENLKIALDALGATSADIVKVTNYVTDRAHLAVLVEARKKILGDIRPASTAVIAGLARDTLLVEVDAVVLLRG